MSWLIWGGFVRTVFVLHTTWLVNSATHVWGYRTHETRDSSTNLWWVALLTYGEGWHNNHHAFQTSARHGLRWWEVDMTYVAIRVLSALGLAHSVKLPTFTPALLLPTGASRPKTAPSETGHGRVGVSRLRARSVSGYERSESLMSIAMTGRVHPVNLSTNRGRRWLFLGLLGAFMVTCATWEQVRKSASSLAGLTDVRGLAHVRPRASPPESDLHKTNWARTPAWPSRR